MNVESQPTAPASGTELEIRAIEPGGKAALAAAVDQSSDEAVYRRFLNPHGRLTAAELRYLTEVDHRDHEALLAVDPGGGKSVGVARYVRDRGRRDSAEIAVAVLESWQGRGVGKALLHRLADRARDEDITQLTALMLSDNRAMRRLLADLGTPRRLSSGAGAVRACGRPSSQLSRVLGAEHPGSAGGGAGGRQPPATPSHHPSWHRISASRH